MLQMTSPLSRRIIDIIKDIPQGKVATYGQIAMMAGHPTGSRQVARLLHSSSGKENLPWHRVINSKGMISLSGEGYDIQRARLEKEGVEFDLKGKIDLKRFLWRSPSYPNHR